MTTVFTRDLSSSLEYSATLANQDHAGVSAARTAGHRKLLGARKESDRTRRISRVRACCHSGKLSIGQPTKRHNSQKAGPFAGDRDDIVHGVTPLTCRAAIRQQPRPGFGQTLGPDGTETTTGGSGRQLPRHRRVRRTTRDGMHSREGGMAPAVTLEVPPVFWSNRPSPAL